MSIKFECKECGNKLRAPDEAAGKTATCSKCGADIRVPGSPSSTESARPRRARKVASGSERSARDEDTITCPVCAEDVSAADNECPYCGQILAGGAPRRKKKRSRSGPPWEQDKPFLSRYFETVTGVLFSPADFFRRMRTSGGTGPPLTFAVIGVTIGHVAGMAYFVIFNIPMLGDPEDVAAGVAAMQGMGTLGILGCSMVAGPIGAVVGCYLYGGILHLLLMVVGGVNRTFETTLRVVAYSMGCGYLLQLIPVVGWILGVGWIIVCCIIGLAQAHTTSTFRTAPAVLVIATTCAILNFM